MGAKLQNYVYGGCLKFKENHQRNALMDNIIRDLLNVRFCAAEYSCLLQGLLYPDSFSTLRKHQSITTFL